MESFFKDLQYGYRTLLKNPGFAAIAVLSLALGIGANTAIFSFINTVLLRDLPVSDPGSLVAFGQDSALGFSWKQYRDFKAGNTAFEGLAAMNSLRSRLYVTIQEAPEFAEANLVSGNFFDVLGVKPSAGHFFDATTDTAPGASLFIVLNDSYWERRFHRSPSAIGQSLRLGDRVFTIVGVAPRGFFGVRVGSSPDMWIPLSMQDGMRVIGRLKPGVSMARAEADVNVLYRRMLPGKHASVRLTPAGKGFSGFREQYETPLRILMIVVAMVLAIACANVANLLLALAANRRKEFALRIAMGAGRGRVIRQLLTESVLLSLAGGFLGILLASAGGKMLVHLISTGPRAVPIDFDLDARVLAFTGLISVGTGILFGIMPALRASQSSLNETLKVSRAGKLSLGRALVAGQVALSLGLLLTAGLLLHSFRNLISLGTGFSRENILLFKLETASAGYREDERLTALYQRIEDRVSRLQGVAAEGVSLFTFNEGDRFDSFTAPGVNLPEKERETGENIVSPSYFSALHIPMLLGRELNVRDTFAAPSAGVVSESFAKKFYGNPARALGQTFTLEGEKKTLTIVGVAADIKLESVRDRETKTVWRSVYQNPAYLHNLAVRVTGDPVQVAAAVRQSIQSVERNLPIRWTTTLADAVGDSLVRERAIAQLSTFFAGLALLLSAIGLYGTISFAVTRRTSEIGIRMALGAERAGVAGMILRDALLVTGAGIAAGLPVALIFTRQMDSLLYGLGAIDLASVLASIAALTFVAAIAGYIPARRAASVDPMAALRYE